MIKAIIFDLDGTLIQTELLKAKSYAQSINTLTKEEVEIDSVLDRFKEYVGLSRLEVAEGLVGDFKEELEKHYDKDSKESMQDWMLNKRLSIYEEMVNDEKLLTNYFCGFNLKLLHEVSKDKFKVVLATMSHLEEADKVLDYLGVKDKLDLILTRDNVEKGKPDPEIYLQAMDKMDLKPEECVILEDSVNGLKAGISSGAHTFAVTNSITHKSVMEADILSDKFIIEQPIELEERVYAYIESQNS